jgi:thiamine-monophosphate kinase
MEHEFSIIEHYFKSIATQSDGVVLGPGDDCAILSFPAGYEACLSTDTLVENVHFPRYCPPHVVAARTMGANLSDLAAMGAEPHSFLLSLTLPSVDEQWLQEFSEALWQLIQRYRISLAGGNLSKGSLSISMTAIGKLPANTAVRRSGAKVGDDIYVSGTLGDAARGLELVKQGNYENYLADRYCEPSPRLSTGMALRGIASSMIDLSDGLFGDLNHVCQASGKGAVIEARRLPISDELRASAGRASAVRMALFSGDDYELCFTAAPAMRSKVKAVATETGVPLTRIGGIREGSEVVAVDRDGVPLPYGGASYQHF